MRLKVSLVLSMLILLDATVDLAFAQASAPTSELRGRVSDSMDAPIAGATITATDIARGTTRSATTKENGRYAILSLQPAYYTLEFRAQGFQSKILDDIKLDVGQTTSVPVTLNPAGVQAGTQSVASGEQVGVKRTEQSSVISQAQIGGLPINRRNFLDLALLTPGISDSDNINDSTDFRTAQTPQSGLSFSGNNGRSSTILVDGASVDIKSDGTSPVLPQEAVQELQVIRNTYRPEFSGASGGIVNIVSKSGTNRFGGSVFGFFRDDSFNARNAFEFNTDISQFNQQQYGGSLGGPIKNDKSFFFAAVEGFNQKQTIFVNLLNDPTIFSVTSRQEELLGLLAGSGSPALIGLGASLRANLVTTTENFPGTIALFNDASGQFPFDSFDMAGSIRIDHIFSAQDNGYVRFNVSDNRFENVPVGALTAVSRGRTNEYFATDLMLSEAHIFSPTRVNEFKAQYSFSNLDVIPNDPIGPELNIEGFGNFGRDIFLPGFLTERRYQISNNFSTVFGAHTLKTGGGFQAINNSADPLGFLGGRFNFGSLQLIPFLVPAASQPAVNSFLAARGRPDLTGVTITSLQAFNLGLAQLYQQGFGEAGFDSFSYRYSFYVSDSWNALSNFTLNLGITYSLDDNVDPIPLDINNVQPRIGFEWDLWSDGNTVVRGGYGIYVGQIDNAIISIVNKLNGDGDPNNINIVLATANSNILGIPNSFVIYRTLFEQGIIGKRSIVKSDLAQFGILPEPGRPLEMRFRLGDDYENPYTQQASLALEKSLWRGFRVEASYSFNRGAHFPFSHDVNPFKQTGPLSPITGQPTFNRFPNPALGLTSDFRNPLVLQDNRYESAANSFYHEGSIQLRKRGSSIYTIDASYTYSKAIDEVTDFNSDFAAQNPLNVRADRALSAFDKRHRFVFTGILHTPSAGNGIVDKVLGDWDLSSIFVGESGRPFNLLLGSIDANGDFRSSSDRPGTAGRNTGKGESFYNVDLRLARRFFASENRYLVFTFDAFNVFNHTNFTGINNAVGTTVPPTGPFNLRGIEGLAPTSPLGFTSAAPARQLQLGVRFSF